MKSTSITTNVVVALGSNLGDRELNLRRAVEQLQGVVHVVRVSSIHETLPLDAPSGSPDFLNMVIAGYTALPATELLDELLAIEKGLGRVRRGRNSPRTIDLDLILYGAHMIRTAKLIVPHPRYRDREFVRGPLRELALGWRDPVTQEWI